MPSTYLAAPRLYFHPITLEAGRSGGHAGGVMGWRPALGEAESGEPKGGGNRLVEF